MVSWPMESWLVWVALLVLFLIGEGFSQSFLTIWLAVGSLAGLVAERLQLSFTWQIVFFSFISLLCIFLLRPISVRILHKATQATNIAALIGQRALALNNIDCFELGQAKINGQIWSAIAVEGSSITQGCYGIIREIRGVKLVLEPIN